MSPHRAAPGTPCTCTEHLDGGPVEVGGHRYKLVEREPWKGSPAWRASCSCSPVNRFRWTHQSPSVAYHAWLDHLQRAKLTPRRRRAMGRARRDRLVMAELLVQLALTTHGWKRGVLNEGGGYRPFAEWPADDPLVTLARTYDVTPADLGRVLDRLGDELEARALACGYADHLDPAPPPPTARSTR